MAQYESLVIPLLISSCSILSDMLSCARIETCVEFSEYFISSQPTNFDSLKNNSKISVKRVRARDSY